MKAQRSISILILLAFCISVPGRVFGDTVDTRAVTQVFVSDHRAPELRIRAVPNYKLPVFGFDFPGSPAAKNINRESLGSESLLAGIDFYSLPQTQDPKVPVGDVDVTICDCGDVLVPVPGGFPKWPLVFLAGIPFLFIKGGEDVLPPIIGPTPPPSTPSLTPTPPIPEPASLFLLLTGLGAVGVRIRRSRTANRNSSKR
jgi:hypothetical protein